MTETSAIMIPEASALTVDTSCIDVSEVENQEDKDFLLEKGENILGIVAQAALDVGKELVEVQEHFHENKKIGLSKFYESLGFDRFKASKWANQYRLKCEYELMTSSEESRERIDTLSTSTSSLIWNLPSSAREEMLKRIEQGDLPTQREIVELGKTKEIKLQKAQEALEGVINKDGDQKNIKRDIENYTQQIADLQAQIEEEKLRTAEQTEESARLEKELQKLKFDDAKVRAERVKKLSSTLTVSIPQVTADVLKFFAEIDEYPEEVKKHVYENARALADQIADRL